MPKRIAIFSIIGLLMLCLVTILVYQLPLVHERLAWRLASWQAKVQRILNPPEQIVFIPGGTPQPGLAQTIAKATLDVILPSATGKLLESSVAPQVGLPTMPYPAATTPVTPQPSLTPTPTHTPIPGKILLTGIVHEYQQFNNCGPANLSMALSYWGWQGDQRDTRLFLRPNREVDDKNVMPDEMVAFVEQFTELEALTRVGGDLEMLRNLLAAGFPVIIEAGHQPRNDWWMGHYLVVSGYNDELHMLTVQDSLANPDQPLAYEELALHWWRDFNYVFVVIYPPEQRAALEGLLGPRIENAYSDQIAAQKALDEIHVLQGRDLFFAWFNLGSNRVNLMDYPGAAQAFDKAFEIYQSLPEDQRPYRMMWYRVEPYQAYYYTGRFQDVVNLANTTFSWVGQPVLEESYYWRGMAYQALGNPTRAIADLKKAAELNPNFSLAHLELQNLGVLFP